MRNLILYAMRFFQGDPSSVEVFTESKSGKSMMLHFKVWSQKMKSGENTLLCITYIFVACVFLIFVFLKDQLGTVEVYGKSHRVERVYFKIDHARRQQWRSQNLQVRESFVFVFKCECFVKPVDPFFFFFLFPKFQDGKEKFYNEVERENQKVKINQFVDFCEVLLL